MFCLLQAGKLIQLCGIICPNIKLDKFFCLTINITFLDVNSDKRFQKGSRYHVICLYELLFNKE